MAAALTGVLLTLLVPIGAPAPWHAPAAPHDAAIASLAGPAPDVPHPFTAPANSTLAIWRQLCDGSGSCASTQATVKPAQFYDPVDDYVVNFGGSATNGASTQRTFLYQNSTWNESFQSTIPGTRSNASAAWDTVDGFGVMFGGWKSSNSLYFGDTWKFQGGAWSLLSPGTSPGSRAGSMMVYVPVVGGTGGYLLLFGGKGSLASTNQLQSDTWKFVGGTWTNITGSAGIPPSARAEGGMAYDALDNYVVLFGGYTAAGPVNSTYKFDPVTSQWTQLFANGSTAAGAGPKAVLDPQMAWDSNDHVLVEMGGATGSLRTSSSETVISQKITYLFVAGTWTNDSANVQARSNAAGTLVPLPTYGAGFTDIPTARIVLLQSGKNTLAVTNVTFAFGTQILVNLTFNLGEVAIGSAFNTVKMWANASIGSPPFTYSWTLPTGCSAGNVSTVTCTPTQAGVFTVAVNVTDTNGAWKITRHRLVIDPSASQTISLSVSSLNPVYLPSTFWAFDYRCSPENSPACISFVKQTPVHWFRVAGSMEGYNATNGKEYSRFGGFGNINWNWPNIVSFCQQISPCHTVAAVPTQINYTPTSVADLNYVEQNYSYTPDFWSLGNEPQGWVNFNKPFSPTPLPLPYTRLNPSNAYQVGIVEDKVARALISANPVTRVVAIQSAACGTSLFNTETAFYTWQDNSPVVACHAYPGGLSSNPATLADFLSTQNLTRTTSALLGERTALAAMCAQCSLPIWLTEFNGANTGSSFQSYMTQWPGVAFDAAELVQFSAMNLSQFEYFYVSCGGSVFSILTAGCGLTPVAGLYENVFNHLAQGPHFNVTSTGAMNGIYAMEAKNSSGTSLLISNTNTTVIANIASLGIPLGSLVTVTTGSSATGWVVSEYSNALSIPTSWSVPPMGVLLINTNSQTPSYSAGGLSAHTTTNVSVKPVCNPWCQFFTFLAQRSPPLVLGSVVVMAVGAVTLVYARRNGWSAIGGSLFTLGMIALLLGV